jgi:serine/threonine-protein phosphatase 2A regulatory subunit B'
MHVADVDERERVALLREKLDFCTTIYDFKDEESDREAKQDKRQVLLELIDFVNIKKSVTKQSYADIVRMVKANIVRSLPPTKRDFDNVEEEDEPTLEIAWPHLQLVYEFFLRFVVSSDTDPKDAKRYIDKLTITQLVDLIDSTDARERDYVKTILHRIYGKFMSHRPFIRRAINNVFFHFIYETPQTHAGISELLEILGSIINGFALPLKAEHKTFLAKVLIPLHKPANIEDYQQQLLYCVTQFVEKDHKLCAGVLMGLLRQWPTVNSNKALMFLGEVEEVRSVRLYDDPQQPAALGLMCIEFPLQLNDKEHDQVVELTQAAEFDAVCAVR